jgi:hypothetical protein
MASRVSRERAPQRQTKARGGKAKAPTTPAKTEEPAGYGTKDLSELEQPRSPAQPHAGSGAAPSPTAVGWDTVEAGQEALKLTDDEAAAFAKEAEQAVLALPPEAKEALENLMHPPPGERKLPERPPPDSGDTAAGRLKKEVYEALDVQVKQLGYPAQLAIFHKWDEHVTKVAEAVERELGTGGSLETLAPKEREALIGEAIDGHLANYRTWMTGTNLALAGVGAPGLVLALHALPAGLATYVGMFGAKLIAAALAPLAIRLTQKLRRASSQANQVEQANSKFHAMFQRIVYLQNGMLTTLARDGRNMSGIAIRSMEGFFNDAINTESSEEAVTKLSLVILNLAVAFPDIQIDEQWARIMFGRIEEKFANQPAYDRLKQVLHNRAPDFDLQDKELLPIVRKILQPASWAAKEDDAPVEQAEAGTAAALVKPLPDHHIELMHPSTWHMPGLGGEVPKFPDTDDGARDRALYEAFQNKALPLGMFSQAAISIHWTKLMDDARKEVDEGIKKRGKPFTELAPADRDELVSSTVSHVLGSYENWMTMNAFSLGTLGPSLTSALRNHLPVQYLPIVELGINIFLQGSTSAFDQRIDAAVRLKTANTPGAERLSSPYLSDMEGNMVRSYAKLLDTVRDGRTVRADAMAMVDGALQGAVTAKSDDRADELFADFMFMLATSFPEIKGIDPIWAEMIFWRAQSRFAKPEAYQKILGHLDAMAEEKYASTPELKDRLHKDLDAVLRPEKWKTVSTLLSKPDEAQAPATA